jgi:hypothetical protein
MIDSLAKVQEETDEMTSHLHVQIKEFQVRLEESEAKMDEDAQKLQEMLENGIEKANKEMGESVVQVGEGLPKS